MPKFLSQDELFNLIERELPPEVYAIGAPSGYYTTADDWAVAGVLADAEDNLERVYFNKFPDTTDESIEDWERMSFGQVSTTGLTLQQRRDRVIAKLRTKANLSRSAMVTAVLSAVSAIGESNIEIAPWGCEDGSWVLDESQLDITTILNGSNQVDAVGPDLCDRDPSEFGKTDEEWAIAKEEAYTYEVRIYNYTLTADERSAIDAVLTAAEKAGSTHVITDSLTDADRVNGST